jgi:hypothetical protein
LARFRPAFCRRNQDGRVNGFPSPILLGCFAVRAVGRNASVAVGGAGRLAAEGRGEFGGSSLSPSETRRR